MISPHLSSKSPSRSCDTRTPHTNGRRSTDRYLCPSNSGDRVQDPVCPTMYIQGFQIRRPDRRKREPDFVYPERQRDVLFPGIREAPYDVFLPDSRYSYSVSGCEHNEVIHSP